MTRLRVLFLLAASWLAFAVTVRAAGTTAVPLLAGQRVVILGDSITQDGRYVTFLEYYLRRLAPATNADLVSIGLGSETVSGLTEPGHPYPRPNALDRVGRALELLKPQVVFACYGMNDGIYHPPSEERQTAFETGLDKLIGQIRATGARLVLLTPPYFDKLPIPQRLAAPGTKEFGYQKTFANYNDVLVAFGRAEAARAAADLQVIDLNGPMAAAVAARRATEPAFTFSPDGVHPGDLGHLFMARIVATALGLKIPDTPLADELARIQADPAFPLIRDRRALRSEAWLAHVGYTRGPSFRSEYVKAAETAATRLQQEIDAALARR